MKNSSSFSEDELVAALKDRSQKAYAVLYDNYASSLLGVICKVVKDGNEAENLLQDTFVKVWNNVDSYDADRGRLFTWLLQIARNTALSYLRSRKNVERRNSISLTDGIHVEQSIVTESINVSHIGMDDTVSRLDPKLRQMIDLIYFEGYTQQNVADDLNMPLGTVKTRTRMALQQLKVIFSDVQ